MKLAAITDEISQEFEHALDVMLEYGARSAELRGLWGTNIADLSKEQAARARRALRDRDMTACSLATPVYKCDLESDEAAVEGRMHLAAARGYGEQLEVLKRCCALAHQFECPFIRVFSFWRRGELTPEIESRIVEAFSGAVRVAEQEGVTLILENEHACFIGTGEEVGRVVRSIGSNRVKVCWDPGNAMMAGETPFPAGYEHVKNDLVHMHVKDGRLGPGGGAPEWCIVGEGQVDYAGQFDALKRDGYRGFVSLETHYIPKGGTPEEGSRPCLAALAKFIEG